jgi:hypothetical protein
MLKVLRAFVLLLSIVFIMAGIRWFVDPAGSSERLGMVLLDGVGRSSQIGDLSAFFLTAGICLLIGIITRRRVWFYPTIMMLGLAAVGRILAWLIHDAAFATPMIAVEVIFASLFLFASRKLASDEA